MISHSDISFATSFISALGHVSRHDIACENIITYKWVLLGWIHPGIYVVILLLWDSDMKMGGDQMDGFLIDE